MDSTQIFRGDTLFGRKIVFEVGESGGEGRLFSTEQGFDLDFDCSFDCSGEPPGATCTIYNPPREFGAFMRQVQSNSFVGISAGYGNNVTRLYVGNVVKDSIKFAKNDADWSILLSVFLPGRSTATRSTLAARRGARRSRRRSAQPQRRPAWRSGCSISRASATP